MSLLVVQAQNSELRFDQRAASCPELVEWGLPPCARHGVFSNWMETAASLCRRNDDFKQHAGALRGHDTQLRRRSVLLVVS
jgi:hypothetical protein